MASLAASESPQVWQAALSSYKDVIQAHAKSSKRRSKLPDLDDFVNVALPDLVRSRFCEDTPFGYITKAELCKIVEWKITRGKFRPLMRYANALDPEEVIRVTGEAFSLARKDGQQATKTLTSMKGIGPATATAILSFCELDGTCPFLSDEAMLAFNIINSKGKLDYTLSNWLALRELCDGKCKTLNSSTSGDTESETHWTLTLIERAIFANSNKPA